MLSGTGSSSLCLVFLPVQTVHSDSCPPCLSLAADGPNGRTAPAHPLRNSAPAAPLLSPKSPLGSDPNGGRRHSLRRSSFLDRKPVPVEMLYGL